MNKTFRLCIQGLASALLVGVTLLSWPGAAAADEGPLAVTETPTNTVTPVTGGVTETPTPTETVTVTATPVITSTVVTETPTPTATVTLPPVISPTPTVTPTAPPQNPQPTSVPVVNLVKRISQDRVVMGSVVQYELIVSNPNDVAVDDVVVQDALPPQVDYVSATSPVGTVSYDATTRVVTVSLGTLAARQEVTIAIQARVNANAATPSPIINQATIIYGRNRGTGSSNPVTAELVPGSLPETGVGPGPREIVTMSLILGMAALTALALYDRSRKPAQQEQPEIIQD